MLRDGDDDDDDDDDVTELTDARHDSMRDSMMMRA